VNKVEVETPPGGGGSFDKGGCCKSATNDRPHSNVLQFVALCCIVLKVSFRKLAMNNRPHSNVLQCVAGLFPQITQGTGLICGNVLCSCKLLYDSPKQLLDRDFLMLKQSLTK